MCDIVYGWAYFVTIKQNDGIGILAWNIINIAVANTLSSLSHGSHWMSEPPSATTPVAMFHRDGSGTKGMYTLLKKPKDSIAVFVISRFPSLCHILMLFHCHDCSACHLLHGTIDVSTCHMLA